MELDLRIVPPQAFARAHDRPTCANAGYKRIGLD